MEDMHHKVRLRVHNVVDFTTKLEYLENLDYCGFVVRSTSIGCNIILVYANLFSIVLINGTLWLMLAKQWEF
jgi:hypothetical protein